MHGHLDIVQQLVQHGASETMTDSKGQNAEKLALLNGQKDVVAFFSRQSVSPRRHTTHTLGQLRKDDVVTRYIKHELSRRGSVRAEELSQSSDSPQPPIAMRSRHRRARSGAQRGKLFAFCIPFAADCSCSDLFEPGAANFKHQYLFAGNF